MNLWHLCESRYFPENPRISDSHTKASYRRAAAALERALGRPALAGDLTDANVLRVMAAITASGRSPVTANHYRKSLCAIWTWCCRQGLLQRWPGVQRLREPKRTPRAWTADELARIVDACKQTHGAIQGVPAPNYWLAYHAVAWDTGERTGAILKLQWEWLSDDVLHVPAEARKGKRQDAVYRLEPDTLAQLDLIREPARKLIFPTGHVTSHWKRYARILHLAGLPVERRNMPQKIRRSHASHLKAAGGDPTASLQHSSDQVTRGHYLDPAICSDAPARMLFRILTLAPGA